MDRYLTRAVLGAWGASLAFMVLLRVLFDVLLNLSRYIENANEEGVGWLEFWGRLIQYYVVNLPFLFVEVAPFVTVIAAMFGVSRLMAANEIVPMVFTGRGITRILAPVLFIGGLAGASMALVWEFVLPRATEMHDTLRGQLDGSTSKIEDMVIRLRDGGHRTLFVDSYDHQRRRMEGIDYIDEGSSDQDNVVVVATAADWNPETEEWELTAGMRRGGGDVRSVDTLAISELTPELLWRTSKESRELIALSYSELSDLEELRPGRRDFELAFQSHITFPLANLILLILALPFAIHFERGRKIERVLFAVLVCALYLVADLACQNLSLSGGLHPIFAAWLPPIVFGSLGMVFFSSVQS